MPDFVLAEVFSPGDYLREELEARGWSQAEFAEIIGRPPRLVNEIIAGKRGITPATAKEIAAALETSPEVWVALDAKWQLYRDEAAPSPRIAKEARLRERFPVREMLKRGWLEPSTNAEVLETRVLQFFNIKSLDDDPSLPFAAKRQRHAEPLSAIQLAWLFRVKQIATAMAGLSVYSAKTLREALPQLHALMVEPEEIRQVPKILAACGVRLVIVEPLPGSKIDGVCFWIKGSPVIGLSLRHDRIDNFWHVLRHELEHVLRGDGKESAIVDSELEQAVRPENATEEEKAATEAAAEFGVPTDELEGFIARVHPLYREERVVGFARRLQVHPGIAVGRLQRRLERYDLLRAHLVKIRHVITPVAMTDGYGIQPPVRS